MSRYLLASMCLAWLVVPGTAHAQPRSQPMSPSPPANSHPEVIPPKNGTTDTSGASVIRPPNVDPGMSVKPPANPGQSKAVVPPRGAPDGKPNPTLQ
jgi:hypothetical protein